jgi:hypothetical protein
VINRAVHITLMVLLCLPAVPASGQTLAATAAVEVDVLVGVQAVAQATILRIDSADRESVPTPVVLTKASNLLGFEESPAPLRLRFADALMDATVIATDRQTDLAMLRLVSPPSLDGPIWIGPPEREPESAPPPGTFVRIAYRGGEATGIVTGPPRVIPGEAKMGIFFAEGSARAVVRGVQAGSGADAAGVRRGDTVLAVDGQPTPTPLDVIEASAGRYVGDTVRLTLQRDQDAPPRTVTVTVGQVRMNADRPPRSRADFIQRRVGPMSVRRSGFPRVLPTDADVPAAACGGSAFAATSGDWLGLVIARRSRTETLILPPTVVAAAIARMREGHEAESLTTPDR